VTVFFDRTIGHNIPDACKLLDMRVEAHRDHFAHDAPDEVWLPVVAEKRWMVVTNDNRIRFNELELTALIENRVGCVMLGSGSRTRREYMRALLDAWSEIERLEREEPRPFIYVLHADGRLERRYPPSDPVAPRRRRRWRRERDARRDEGQAEQSGVS